MRRYASTRCLSFPVERGSTQSDPSSSVVFQHLQRRRIHAPARSSTRFSTRWKYGAANPTLRQRMLGLTCPSTLDVPPHYSTAKPESDQSLDGIPDLPPSGEGGFSGDVSLDTRGGSSNQPSSAISHPALMETSSLSTPYPKPEDFDGLGRAFLEVPKDAFVGQFVNRNLVKLDIAMESGTVGYRCILDCTASQPLLRVTVDGEGSRKKAAEANAFRDLISILYAQGNLQRLADKAQGKIMTQSMPLSLKLNEDVLLMMRRTLLDLVQAPRVTLPSGRSISSYLDEAKAFGHRDIRRPALDLRGKKVTAQRPIKDQRSSEMRKQLEHYLQLPRLAPLRLKIGALQVSQRKKEILDHIRDNTYSIVVAATGSGKSTQIPQIILNDAIMNDRGAYCRVICVQPRRIAATSLARRVASERNEDVGKSVGYHVRFDRVDAAINGSITYYTTGILLELLQYEIGFLDSVSHIVLDEVHERSAQLDLIMLLLKTEIERRLAKGEHAPKLIITSATLDVDRFATYFQNKLPDGTYSPAPHVSIPGHTFQVTRHYLDHLLDSFSRSGQIAFSTLRENVATRQYLEDERQFQLNRDKQLAAPEDHCPEDESPEEPPTDPINAHVMPIALISAAVCHVLNTTKEGAVLVFLPGISDIIGVEQYLLTNQFGVDFSNTRKFQIIKLHSALPQYHAEPFQATTPGCRRIFLSTNIAETSITIPDVKYVIDTGKGRQNNYYVESRSRELGHNWVSQSCVSQRAGRAGRVVNGEYFALYSKERYESFTLTMAPEITRSDLRELCLRTKRIAPRVKIWGFLQGAIDPPDESRVRDAVENLKYMGALDANEKLTVMGGYLAGMPVSVSLGKLILLGIVFRCLDPLLILASLEADPNLFTMVFEDEERQRRAQYRRESSAISSSDHMGAINIYKTLRSIYYDQGPDAARAFATSQFLNFNRFQGALRVARDLRRHLVKAKLILEHQAEDDIQFGGPELNVNSGRSSLIKALLLHVNSLNIATPRAEKGRFYRTSPTQSAQMASYSVNHGTTPRTLFVYDWKQPTSPSQRFFVLNNTTHVTPLAACLFGGPLQVNAGRVHLNSWLHFTIHLDAPEKRDFAIKLMLELRKVLDKTLEAAVLTLTRDPRISSWEHRFTRRIITDALVNTLVLVLDGGFDPNHKLRAPSSVHQGWAI